MQELVGRLTALDPEASESLKVIAYFDALVDGHASPEVMLRGAAVLSGCAAGFEADGTSQRVDSSGARSAATAPGDWSAHPCGDGGRAWLERSGAAHANDEMILERLAIALGIALDRSSPVAASRRAIETVIDGTAPAERRLAAAARLHLEPTTPYRVVAVPASCRLPGHSVTVGTRVGAVRVSVHGATDAQPEARSGIGLAVTPDALDRSWASALVALRLTTVRHPVALADDLGSVLLLADAADAAPTEIPDLVSLRRLLQSQPKALALLESMATTDSLRAAAVDAGLHHSTVQARSADFATALGFDLRTPPGRVRLSLALSLLRLATNRFD